MELKGEPQIAEAGEQMVPTAPAHDPGGRRFQPVEGELTQCDSLTVDAEEKVSPLPRCISGTSHCVLGPR